MFLYHCSGALQCFTILQHLPKGVDVLEHMIGGGWSKGKKARKKTADWCWYFPLLEECLLILRRAGQRGLPESIKTENLIRSVS